MVYRPYRSIGRFGLAACAVSFGVASLSAQSAPSTTAPVGPNPSRVDLFLGFSYYGAHGEVKPANLSYSSINEGAVASGAYYFNKYVGAELLLVSHPSGYNDGMFAGGVGLIARAPMENFTLFAHSTVGGARLGGPNTNTGVYDNDTQYEPYTWGPSLTIGGGMDYALPFFKNRFSLRLFEADYRFVHTDFGFANNGVIGGRTNLSGVDLDTGIVTHFGSVLPPKPVTYSCAVSPATVFPGDPITVTGTALELNPKKPATYTWTSTGGTITGTSSTASIDTKSAAPGAYSVKGHVSEGPKAGQMADCSADFTVKAYEAPTLTCSASPSTVNPGDSAAITASGISPQNRPLTYSYSASAGSVSGTSNTATLATTGAAPGTITVTCNVADDKGQTATAQTQVTVLAPPPPPAKPQALTLCAISFDRDKKRPTRVDNEAKACLDDLALSLQRSTDAALDVVGNAASTEKDGPKLAAERAVNTKDYLVKEKGIDASRILVFTGADDAKTVTDTLIPSGAPTVKATPVDETAVKAIPRKALAVKKHHKKAHAKS
jgi:outer membrane protein OmpA-like peptidoglycan-associated protein